MLKRFLKTSSVLMAISLVAACSKQSTIAENAPIQPTEKSHGKSDRTIKPGAAVSFSHEFDSALVAGQPNAVTITIAHDYADGMLSMQANGSGIVEVSSSNTQKTVPLFERNNVDWRIDFTPTGNGVGYINLLASVSHDTGETSSRSYAVRVALGDTAAAKTNPDGDVILEAEETIID